MLAVGLLAEPFAVGLVDRFCIRTICHSVSENFVSLSVSQEKVSKRGVNSIKQGAITQRTGSIAHEGRESARRSKMAQPGPERGGTAGAPPTVGGVGSAASMAGALVPQIGGQPRDDIQAGLMGPPATKSDIRFKIWPSPTFTNL